MTTDSTPPIDDDALDAAAADPIGLDLELIQGYRWFLHGEFFKESFEAARPHGLDFGNNICFAGHQDYGDEFYFDFGRGRDGYHEGSCILDRMEQLMAAGMEECAAEDQAIEEGMNMSEAFDAAWSDDLIPKVVVRIGSPEAFFDELKPHLTAHGLIGTEESVDVLIDEHLGKQLRWSEIHWMDRGEPVEKNQPAAWRSPGGSIEVLEGATREEIEWVSRILNGEEEAWEAVGFIGIEDEEDEDDG